MESITQLLMTLKQLLWSTSICVDEPVIYDHNLNPNKYHPSDDFIPF